MLSAALAPHRREFLRAIANHKYEVTASGIHVPSMKLDVAGHFETTVNHRDPQVDPNIIPTVALNLLLDALMPGGAGKQWYVGLFAANVTPALTLTGANWSAQQTEFTNYVEANRVTYVNGAAAAGSLDNDDDRAEFTMSGGATIYGGALCEAQGKGATTGVLLACAKFAAGRAVLAGDTLQVKYTLSAVNTP